MIEEISQVDPQGRPHGLWERYRADGTICSSGYYKNNKPQGLWGWIDSFEKTHKKKYYIDIK
jgi:antitoxin component YwqK of YwqJK toxin-antitoxin module